MVHKENHPGHSKVSTFWMVDLCCIGFHGSVVPPTRTFVSSTPMMSPDTMDMLSSSLMGTWKNCLQKTVHINVELVVEL